ncbi:MAG: M23 family metallopeptidase [Oscillospiraceae bacterium]|nr:M23 family metallopeptidase [Oscillospiraceae bacterium]
MKKANRFEQVAGFIMGKGFYIALVLCFAAIGVSGYYLVNVFGQQEQPPQQAVTGQAQVQVPIQGEKPIQPPAPDRIVNPPEVEKPAPAEPQPEPEPEAATAAEPEPARPVYTWPVKGEVMRDFSLEVLAYDETMGDWRTHSGLDIAAAAGTRVLALGSGTVKRVYHDELMGTAVVIDHGQGLESSYYNLTAKPTVAEGDSVVTGTVIGAVGDTAAAESGLPAHLHFEMSYDGRAIDPIEYLPQY